jgi:hypothetical protein
LRPIPGTPVPVLPLLISPSYLPSRFQNRQRCVRRSLCWGTGAWRLIGAVRTLRRDQLMRSDCGLASIMLRLAISM